jgi:hypothetical protein
VTYRHFAFPWTYTSVCKFVFHFILSKRRNGGKPLLPLSERDTSIKISFAADLIRSLYIRFWAWSWGGQRRCSGYEIIWGREIGTIICSRWKTWPPKFCNPFVGIEVLTAVVIKSSVFGEVTPCSPLNIHFRVPPPVTSLCFWYQNSRSTALTISIHISFVTLRITLRLAAYRLSFLLVTKPF